MNSGMGPSTGPDYSVESVVVLKNLQRTESPLAEADRLVDGDRQSDYGHPADDFAKTAKMFTGVLLPKLRDGVEITAKDVALLMCCVKISREVNRHKRDNLVDLAGYAKTAWMVEQRKESPCQSNISSTSAAQSPATMTTSPGESKPPSPSQGPAWASSIR